MTSCLGMTSLGVSQQSTKALLQARAAHHHSPLEILLGDAAGTEHVPVREVLGGHIPDGKFGQDHLGS